LSAFAAMLAKRNIAITTIFAASVFGAKTDIGLNSD